MRDMSRRIITTENLEEDVKIESHLRPQLLDDYIGQPVTGIAMMTFPYVLIICIAVLALGYGYARRKRNV